MGTQFSAIHNLVRTYQRVLNLEPSDHPKRGQPALGAGDRVSISSEARGLQQASLVSRKEQTVKREA
jgi:hypothetical protein